jgi:hypothetical protein
MFLSSGSATGRSSTVRKVVRDRLTLRSTGRQWIEPIA